MIGGKMGADVQNTAASTDEPVDKTKLISGLGINPTSGFSEATINNNVVNNNPTTSVITDKPIEIDPTPNKAQPEPPHDADDMHSRIRSSEIDPTKTDEKPQPESTQRIIDKSKDEIPPNTIQSYKSENGFIAITSESIKADYPASGPFLLLAKKNSTEDSGDHAVENLRNEHKIKLAATAEAVKMLMSDEVINEKETVSFNVPIETSAKIVVIYAKKHDTLDNNINQIFKRGRLQYKQFKTTMAEICTDINRQNDIIKIIIEDYQEKYGKQEDGETQHPKIGNIEIGEATLYQLVSDTAIHLGAIDTIISTLPENEYVKIMNLCTKTIIQATENAILVNMITKKTQNTIETSHGNPSKN